MPSWRNQSSRPHQQIPITPQKPGGIKLRHPLPQIPISLPFLHQDPPCIRLKSFCPENGVPSLLRLCAGRHERLPTPRTRLCCRIGRVIACQLPAEAARSVRFVATVIEGSRPWPHPHVDAAIDVIDAGEVGHSPALVVPVVAVPAGDTGMVAEDGAMADADVSVERG